MGVAFSFPGFQTRPQASAVETAPTNRRRARRSLLVRRRDLASRRFGERIGVVLGAEEEQDLRLLLGEASGWASIKTLTSIDEVDTAFDARLIDSFYALESVCAQFVNGSDGRYALCGGRSDEAA
ncbi:MAG: hypothetical protein AAFW46_13120 [Pseudomonadota bacterium]